eukprot:jgi/Mesen1/9269/ME000060S08710
MAATNMICKMSSNVCASLRISCVYGIPPISSMPGNKVAWAFSGSKEFQGRTYGSQLGPCWSKRQHNHLKEQLGSYSQLTPAHGRRSCQAVVQKEERKNSTSPQKDAGLHLADMLVGGGRMTDVAHQLWRSVVRPGDTVVDATCGNGHDALAMARLALLSTASRDDGSQSQGQGQGRVVAVDVQASAVERTHALLSASLAPMQMERVSVREGCHTRLRDFVAPSSASVYVTSNAAVTEFGVEEDRLVSFNLGYLPGGAKDVVTTESTTMEALRAAADIVAPGGLICVLAYVGHAGGWEEYQAVHDFARDLPVEDWVCSEQRCLNRNLCPRLLLLHCRP